MWRTLGIASKAEADIRTLLLPTWLLGVWDRLRTSFWFLPTIMAIAAVALSFGLVQLDAALGPDAVRRLGWLYEFGPEGARAVLSAIASSMMTVAGLTFSITMLTLQLASSQFGPRLLRSFMRDRGNQLVLGTFTSTFLYCLLVLRTVRGTEGASFVPHLSVAFGVLLAALSLAVLIYFIHHVATGIRIETVLAELGKETQAAIDRLFPEQVGQEPSAPGMERKYRSVVEEFGSQVSLIRVKESGYVQRVDDDALMRIATESDLVIRVAADHIKLVLGGVFLMIGGHADIGDCELRGTRVILAGSGDCRSSPPHRYVLTRVQRKCRP